LFRKPEEGGEGVDGAENFSEGIVVIAATERE